DDGSGTKLYAGGSFMSAGGVPASRIAQWNGTAWSSLAGGVDGIVTALLPFDDGGGTALYVGGDFASASSVTVHNLARWDGAWSALDTGPDRSLSSFVESLASFDAGSGPELYAGGGFSAASGAPAGSIARWDGATWSPLGSGMGEPGGPSVGSL